MKTKKLSLYSKILISVVIAFVVLLVAAVLLLWNWLSAYEGSQPKYVANSIFQKYFVTLDIEGLNNSCKNQELPFETSDFVKSEISKLYDSSKFQLFRLGTKQNGDEEYAVAFNNKQIANFVLVLLMRRINMVLPVIFFQATVLIFLITGMLRLRCLKMLRYI